MDGNINTMNRVMVTIVVATYNHEKYIEKAIKSIFAQEMDFNYEVLIGEDCSTDNTKTVLKQLASKLPSNFKIYFRDENMGRKGQNNFDDLYSRARGKYIIVLEGDDFWTYNYKLKRQVEFLEEHSEYIAVAHNTKIVDENDDELNEQYNECDKSEYTFDDYRNELLAGQTTTILRRNPRATQGYRDFRSSVDYPGDQRTNFVLLCNGKIKCIQEQWSAYRHITSGGTSYSATHKDDIDYSKRRLVFFREMVDYTRNTFPNNIKALNCIESIYMYYLLKDIFEKADYGSTLVKWISEFLSVNNKIDTIHYIRKRILKKLKLRKKYKYE